MKKNAKKSTKEAPTDPTLQMVVPPCPTLSRVQADAAVVVEAMTDPKRNLYVPGPSLVIGEASREDAARCDGALLRAISVAVFYLSGQIRLCGTGGAGGSVVREVVPGRHCFEEGTARAPHLAGGGRM